MSFTRVTVRAEAKAIAQDGSVVPLLKTDPGDYNKCIDEAQRMFSDDKPNYRVVDQVLAATSFRQVLSGAGALSGLTGLDAWVDGASRLVEVWHPYLAAQDELPIDQNEYRLVRDPGPKVVLHFQGTTPGIGTTLRLVFTNPHVVDEAVVGSTSVLPGDKEPFILLTAYHICLLAAVRFAQNTGSTNLPNDVVDRRSQSDIMKARAKDLLDRYNSMVGKGGKEDLKGASAFGDLDVNSSHPWGLIWHPTGNR